MTAAHARMLFTITNTLSERENRGRADLSGPSGWESKRSSEGIRVKRRFSSSPEKIHRHRQSRGVGFRIIALDLRKIRFCCPRRIDAHSALALAKGLRRFSKRNESEESEKGRIANIPSQNGERKRTIQSRKSEKTVISRGPASERRARVVIFVNIAYAYVRKAISCTSVTRTGTV